MKFKIHETIPLLLLLFIAGCGKRNFFPDEDDPGLNRLTSRGYNIATTYINNVPYINPYRSTIFGGISNTVPTVTLIPTNSTFDTLDISWQIEINVTPVSYNQPYNSISLLMPVPKNFTSHNFLGMSGQRFSSNTNSIVLNSFDNYSGGIAGKSNIYFVNIKYTDSSATSSTRNYAFSGLFNGNIGDSILITKGRFDFKIDASQIKF